MKLVTFVNYDGDGSDLYINPDHVCAVLSDEEYIVIYTIDNKRHEITNIPLNEIMGKLIESGVDIE